jgi:hypothetical protein
MIYTRKLKLYFSFSILYPVSYILSPLSCLLYPDPKRLSFSVALSVPGVTPGARLFTGKPLYAVRTFLIPLPGSDNPCLQVCEIKTKKPAFKTPVLQKQTN